MLIIHKIMFKWQLCVCVCVWLLSTFCNYDVFVSTGCDERNEAA